MFSTDDTIAAISTPIAPAGIGVIRLSGTDAFTIADKVFKGTTPLSKSPAYTAQYGLFVNPGTSQEIDQTICLVMKAPATFTGEDVIEFSLHGSPLLLREALSILCSHGARQAEPGEFTFRAYMNGKISLTQSEAIHQLINARSESGMRNAFLQLQGSLQNKLNQLRSSVLNIISNFEAEIEFPEEGLNFISTDEAQQRIRAAITVIENLANSYDLGKKMEEGINIVICGPPNSGKSTLLNALLNEEKAIVHDTPGTTRDVIEGRIEIQGAVINLIDTAGIRETKQAVEEEGIKRTFDKIKNADLTLLVHDSLASRNGESEFIEKIIADKNPGGQPHECIRLLSKADLLDEGKKQKLLDRAQDDNQIVISAKEGWGLDNVRETISKTIDSLNVDVHEGVIISSLRQSRLLQESAKALENALNGLRDGISYEYLSVDLNEALDKIDSVIGSDPTLDVYDLVFKNFCIGK